VRSQMRCTSWCSRWRSSRLRVPMPARSDALDLCDLVVEDLDKCVPDYLAFLFQVRFASEALEEAILGVRADHAHSPNVLLIVAKHSKPLERDAPPALHTFLRAGRSAVAVLLSRPVASWGAYWCRAAHPSVPQSAAKRFPYQSAHKRNRLVRQGIIVPTRACAAVRILPPVHSTTTRVGYVAL
jgi:hypothetical protein